MTNHIPIASEVRTADEARAAALAHRRAAAGLARREAAARGELPEPGRRTLTTSASGLLGSRADAPPKFDPYVDRGRAPKLAGNRRTWNVHHSLADELLARATELETEERSAMPITREPEPNSLEESLQSRLSLLEQQLRQRQAADQVSPPTSARGYDQVVRVTDEPAQYRADHARTGQASYLVDLYRAQRLGDPQALERLARHGREVESRGTRTQRDATTSSVPGFVPPQYLADQFAEYARAGRPTADLVTSMPLPPTGMTISIPRITTPTLVAAQATENATVSEASPASTLLSVPVTTTAGFTDIARQAIERGELVEQAIIADLAAAYNAELDRQILNGTGTNGEHLGILATTGINAVTYTDASPTVVELWPKLASAVGQVVSGRYSGPSAIVLSPATWAWLVASLDSSNRPLMAPTGNGPANAFGTTAAPGYGGPVGQIMGLPVILDGNMPANLGAGTNETRLAVADFRDSWLWQDPAAAPAQLRFDDIGSSSLTCRLSAYGYSAFTAGRQPKAVSVISGTGLITPSL